MLKADDYAHLAAKLHNFSRYMFRSKRNIDMLDNWHQARICKALQRVYTGRINRLIINVPPRSGKTEVAVKAFISWAMGLAPDSEFIHASYSKRLATANAYDIRAMMQHEAYKLVFPWLKLQDDSKAKDEFRTTAGGIVYATGAEGTITGYGASKMRDSFGGAIIIDDPHKAGGDLSRHAAVGHRLVSEHDTEPPQQARWPDHHHHAAPPRGGPIRLALEWRLRRKVGAPRYSRP